MLIHTVQVVGVLLPQLLHLELCPSIVVIATNCIVIIIVAIAVCVIIIIVVGVVVVVVAVVDYTHQAVDQTILVRLLLLRHRRGGVHCGRGIVAGR